MLFPILFLPLNIFASANPEVFECIKYSNENKYLNLIRAYEPPFPIYTPPRKRGKNP